MFFIFNHSWGWLSGWPVYSWGGFTPPARQLFQVCAKHVLESSCIGIIMTSGTGQFVHRVISDARSGGWRFFLQPITSGSLCWIVFYNWNIGFTLEGITNIVSYMRYIPIEIAVGIDNYCVLSYWKRINDVVYTIHTGWFIAISYKYVWLDTVGWYKLNVPAPKLNLPKPEILSLFFMYIDLMSINGRTVK